MDTRKKEPFDETDVSASPDPKTDQDFPGFPHAPSGKEQVKPVTENEHKVADTGNKDGEKVNYHESTDEQKGDGSGGAFESTEQ